MKQIDRDLQALKKQASEKRASAERSLDLLEKTIDTKFLARWLSQNYKVKIMPQKISFKKARHGGEQMWIDFTASPEGFNMDDLITGSINIGLAGYGDIVRTYAFIKCDW